MSKVILTVGPSACGKTTWANEQVKKNKGKVVNVNRDDIRRSLFMFDQWKDYKFTGQRETLVTETQFAMAKSAIDKGLDVIVSDTNLNPTYRKKWEEFAKANKVAFELEVFRIDIKELTHRNLNRQNSVEPSVLRKQYVEFMMQFGGLVKYEPDYTKPKAVIFDLDGTLAIMGDRGPFEWSRVKEDTVNENVADLLRMVRLVHPDWMILTVSGRDGVCSELTQEWLSENKLSSDRHYQRKAGDQRRDSEVKQEIFWEHIAPNFNVLYAVDDRQQVVDMWDMLGVEVWQVQQNDF